MNNRFTFDKHGYIIDGKRQFLVSGEIPYFRVPKQDWGKRLRLLRDAGANCVSTYVPWCIHEPEEGNIRFGDCEERDLPGFLELAQKTGLYVFLRPGPYQYSELIGDGIPLWLYNDYPETHARKEDGSEFDVPVYSYLHPVFLEKVKAYLDAFSRMVFPYLAQNGGPVVCLQLDNELAGVHIWNGSLDYHADSMGIGKPGGSYPAFLQKRYGAVEELNRVYRTQFRNFEEVSPTGMPADPSAKFRMRQDYLVFYCGSLNRYTLTLKRFLTEAGVTEPVCINAANTHMTPLFSDINRTLGKNALLGLDSYYVLNYGSGQLTPTPKYTAENIMLGADLLRQFGNPYTVLEMQAGTYTDIPPLTPKGLNLFYMTHLAMGLKGLNYYIFSGGKNSGNYNATAAVYDYQACVSASGKKRPNFRIIRNFSTLLKENPWLSDADRVSSVQVGVDLSILRNDYISGAPDQNYRSRLADCPMFTLFASKYAAEYTEMSQNTISTDKPLLLLTSETLSRSAQQNVISFVRQGGRLLILGKIAAKDEHNEPYSALADFIGIRTAGNDSLSPTIRMGVQSVYNIHCPEKISSLQPNDRPLIYDGSGKNILGIEGKRDAGTFLYFGATWRTATFGQAELLESILERLGAVPTLKCSDRRVCYAVRRASDRTAIFLLNFFSESERTDVTLYSGGETIDLGTHLLKPFEAKMLVYPALG